MEYEQLSDARYRESSALVRQRMESLPQNGLALYQGLLRLLKDSQ